MFLRKIETDQRSIKWVAFEVRIPDISQKHQQQLVLLSNLLSCNTDSLHLIQAKRSKNLPLQEESSISSFSTEAPSYLREQNCQMINLLSSKLTDPLPHQRLCLISLFTLKSSNFRMVEWAHWWLPHEIMLPYTKYLRRIRSISKFKDQSSTNLWLSEIHPTQNRLLGYHKVNKIKRVG